MYHILYFQTDVQHNGFYYSQDSSPSVDGIIKGSPIQQDGGGGSSAVGSDITTNPTSSSLDRTTQLESRCSTFTTSNGSVGGLPPDSGGATPPCIWSPNITKPPSDHVILSSSSGKELETMFPNFGYFNGGGGSLKTKFSSVSKSSKELEENSNKINTLSIIEKDIKGNNISQENQQQHISSVSLGIAHV